MGIAMRRLRLLLAACVLLSGFAAHAAEFRLPGLERDANAYAGSLTARSPAGGTPAARRTAEQRAGEAERKGDWAGAAQAWEARIALGEASAAQWMALALAQFRRSPPEATRALQAAWQAFANAPEPSREIPALLVMADALKVLNRPAQAIQALEAAAERAPDDDRLRQALADLRRATGVLVTRVTTEREADPPRACLGFSVPLVRRDDFNPQDWVRLDPPVPGAAATREGELVCVSGLPNGETTRIILRAGMPGADGLTLVREAVVPVAMGNRAPRIIFDQRMFVLPRGQTPAITLGTVNLSAVKLALSRLSERNVVAFIRENRLGEQIDGWSADSIGEETGRIVWQGGAEIPRWQPNRVARTALPLPEAMASAGPGVYALIARAGDGTPQGAPVAVQMIIRTDLAPTVWRGSDGLTVQVRGFSDVAPRAGVRLQLLARNNDVLATATTDDQGVARFPRPLLRGEGPLEPRALHAFGPGDDFVSLDLNAAAFDLSDRGVTGQPHPGPLDAFVWLDRGIYRPGETVQIMALLRDAGGAPADFPARVTVRRPNGQVFHESAPSRLAEASVHLPLMLSASAPSGTWVVEVRADPAQPPIGRADFRVDAFVPDRMAVEVGPVPGPIVAGQAYTLPVMARFLYGAPGAGLTGTANWRLLRDDAPFPALSGYRIGLIDEVFAPPGGTIDLTETDSDGRTSLPIRLARVPDTTRALKAEIEVTVNDPGGRGSRAVVAVPVRPAGRLIGIRPLFPDGAIDAGAEAGFEVAAVDPDGKRVALATKLRLVRERPDWRLVTSGSVARYQIVWKDEPLETHDLAIGAAAPALFAKKLDFGRYRLEVVETGDLAAASVRFRAGWVSSGAPDVPDQVDVSAERAVYAPGTQARVHIAPPFSGRATLVVLTDRVMMLRNIEVAESGSDVMVPVSADWGPGAYVAVHAFRAAGSSGAAARPARAIGLTWIGVDPATRRIELALDVPEKFPPRAQAIVPVRGTPGSWVTLAAVDEGILRLTNFASPDPAPHFLGRRRLGLDIRDDWGRLIAPAEGEAALLRQGGDDGSFVLPDTPVRTVTLFTPPRQIGPDGKLDVPLDLPDFAGQVRLMAVGWNGARIGAAAAQVLVRDPVVAEPLLPRFLAPGDETRFAVLMQNLDLSDGEVTARVSLDGPLALAGDERLAVRLAKGQQAVPATRLRATGAGRGVVRIAVTGPDGFTVQRETAITIRPARGATTFLAGAELPPDAEATLAPGADRFMPGTWRARAVIGGAVRYDVPAMLRLLDDYALRCLEQATSRGLPLALLPDGPLAGPDRAARLQETVAQVLDRQRFDGGFGLWSAGGEAQGWLSVYATDFLLRARSAGAAVPDQAVQDALKFLGDETDNAGVDAQAMADQAYRLMVLARAGKGRPGAARVLAENLNVLPTPLARAQLGAALALAHDRPRAEAAFRSALDAPARQFWYGDYGSALRDQFAVVLLLKESGLLADRLAAAVRTLPGAELAPAMLSTQEQAWAAGAAAVLGRDGQPVRVSLDGIAVAPSPTLTVALDQPAVLRNLDRRPVWQAVSATGVPVTALPAARNLMSVRRRFLAMDGQALNLDTLRQNTIFVLVLEGRAEDGQGHVVQLMHGLPAGWEIAGRFAEGDVPGLPWIGKLSATDAQPAADDRFAAALTLAERPGDFRVAVKLRAVTPGTFELPGAELSDMYRPALFARQAVGRITVQAAE
jgi:uncharacterized protein YfaS (alpha-2-macroglobulin family)